MIFYDIERRGRCLRMICKATLQSSSVIYSGKIVQSLWEKPSLRYSEEKELIQSGCSKMRSRKERNVSLIQHRCREHRDKKKFEKSVEDEEESWEEAGTIGRII